MRYLITGISGFVGGHYAEYLLSKYPGARISGIAAHHPKFDFLEESQKKRIRFYRGSLLRKNWVRQLIKDIRPDYIVNLAAKSSVAYSWKNPAECYRNNTGIFLNVVEGVRKSGRGAKILSVGSAEEYGIVRKGASPITEEFPLNPVSPYAIGRVSQEYFSKIYIRAHRIPIICTRSFNHIGPRQRDTFVVSSFAKQVAEAGKGLRKEIVCGNLDIIRDFADVRDVVRAYDLLLRKGRVGDVYNVCSGKGYRLSEVLRMLREEAGVKKLKIRHDPALMRPVENKVLIGSCKKLEKDTGFKRQYTLSGSLKDILAYWDRLL
jgi:GDP-4-dehydro-6-deoxy-D-mannose reductase